MGEMALPAGLAWKLGGAPSPWGPPLAFLAASPLLWTAAYLLNDLSDADLDRDNPLKARRPVSSGALSRSIAYGSAVVLALAAFGLGFFLGPRVLLSLAAMALSQVLYTCRPFRWKERPGLDLFSNFANSAARSCAVWSATCDEPLRLLVPLLVALGLLKTVLFLGHRLQSRSFEAKHGIRGTTVRLSRRASLGLAIGLGVGSLGLFLHQAVAHGVLGTWILVACLGLVPIVPDLLWPSQRVRLLEQERDEGFRKRLYAGMALAQLAAAVALAWG